MICSQAKHKPLEDPSLKSEEQAVDPPLFDVPEYGAPSEWLRAGPGVLKERLINDQ